MFNCHRKYRASSKVNLGSGIFLLLLLLFLIIFKYNHDLFFQITSLGKEFIFISFMCNPFPTSLYHSFICISILLSNILIDRLISSFITRYLLIRAGIETNPGPIPRKLNYAFWNVDSLLARDGHKISVIQVGLNSNYNFDVFGIVESYLNKDILDDQIKIKGFSPAPFRADSPASNRPKGGVCLYYNENLPIKNRADLVCLEETILAETKLDGKKIFILLSYRSPSQSTTELSSYCDKLQSILDKVKKEKPHLIIFSGDLNARSPLFWDNEREENPPGKN